jgi:nicotinamide-nucleotide amidase
MTELRAEIIAVGSEMLTPTHIDTNSLFITERLNEIGIDLQGKAVAGDDRAVLKSIVSDALDRCDLLILTGGLGPTDDDVTRDVVADVIGQPLEYHANIFEAIEKRFASRGLRTPEINRRQAMVPRGAAVLPNANGTAPGLWIQHSGKLLVLLPGPPRELKPMMESVIQERLLGHVGASRLFRRLLRITGQSESSVEEKMQPLYARWLAAPTKITTTILASLGQIELHLTALASSADAGHRALDGAVADVRAALGRDLFSTNNETMQQVVGALLRERGLTIAAAESCTGGLVMARLTEVPGSSDYVDRGVVVYTNQSKTDLLNVPPQLIEAHGAVSEPVAQAMASGMVRLAGTNFAVGITGVAGPTGGTSEKPVGMVAIAAAWSRNNTIDTRVRTFNFIGGREMVRFQASQAALDMVRRWMLE